MTPPVAVTAPPGAAAAAAAPAVPPPITPSAFNICVSRISSEAASVIDERILAGGAPGSEYANAVTSSSSASSSNINTITGLRKHRHNPEGIFCTTVGCNKGDHDHAHCYGKGGGMEGQAPWMKNKRKDKDMAAAAIVPSPPPVPPPLPSSTVIAAYADATAVSHTFLADLSVLPLWISLTHSPLMSQLFAISSLWGSIPFWTREL
ncbi:uncharacterized protein F5147DRAFT_777704 [Suillus discolor]|uniref:Uncharacterized protein n=1 Tax=Suillus discolor TaxID=1912936 RepID=A0A9P7F098_9AGAM|nr:uncharacterized protein F5147DRAFT_777704 [Suillus discolor]KAG2098462.1 hypothetical protein F5147DRAFT_777704 [Suillus discolor]